MAAIGSDLTVSTMSKQKLGAVCLLALMELGATAAFLLSPCPLARRVTVAVRQRARAGALGLRAVTEAETGESYLEKMVSGLGLKGSKSETRWGGGSCERGGGVRRSAADSVPGLPQAGVQDEDGR